MYAGSLSIERTSPDCARNPFGLSASSTMRGSDIGTMGLGRCGIGVLLRSLADVIRESTSPNQSLLGSTRRKRKTFGAERQKSLNPEGLFHHFLKCVHYFLKCFKKTHFLHDENPMGSSPNTASRLHYLHTFFGFMSDIFFETFHT